MDRVLRCPGLKRLLVPLLSNNDSPGAYTLRLVFGSDKGDLPGQRAFDVRVQDAVVCSGVDVVAQSRNDMAFLVREVKNVAVSDYLVIEFRSRHETPTPLQMPILCGLEVERCKVR